MGWRDALERQLWAECAGKRVEVYSALTAMPAPDRIAMARELLAGTGRVVARDVAHLDGVGEFMVADNERMRQAMVWARMAGWNACREAMREDTP